MLNVATQGHHIVSSASLYGGTYNRGRDGSLSEREADPLGLVAKAGVWYLAARVAAGEHRSFRAERIVAADETGATFTRPPDFNLDGFWRETIVSLERRARDAFVAVLRIRATALERIAPYWNTEVVSDEPDWATLRARFPSRDLAVLVVRVLGCDVEIVEPPELGRAIAERAADALARYSDSRP